MSTTNLQFTIEPMVVDDYDNAMLLWRKSEGIGLHHDDCDSKQGIGDYLMRNPGLSFVARQGGQIVGAVLCGHDGRRGYLQHLAVAPPYRGQGIGRTLVSRVLTALSAMGIRKYHIFVFKDNRAGRLFWEQIGWAERVDLVTMSSMTQLRGKGHEVDSEMAV